MKGHPLTCLLMLFSQAPLRRTFTQHRPAYVSYHTSLVCHLNRFLFDNTELLHPDDCPSTSVPLVRLKQEDYRTVHAARVLGLGNGDRIRAGLVSCDDHKDGLSTDEATVEWLPEGKRVTPVVKMNGKPPGSLMVNLHNLKAPTDTSDELLVSLILALPRPLQLGRILPMVSQMGVDQLVLTGAQKVPKDYFGSHLFRKPEALRERLVEGLCQSGDVRLPELHLVRNLSQLKNEMDVLFPLDKVARVIAHPQRGNEETLRMGNIQFPTTTPPRVVIAVGPEGGWGEPDELNQFRDLGFQQVTLGSRTLRSDCAVISLLSLAQEVCHERR